VDCETDFVARTEPFQEFARDVALHIAAAAPLYVSDEDVPEEARQAEQRIYEEQSAADGKPEQVREKIVEGRVGKWLDQIVLLRQRHVNEDRHGGKTIEELRTEIAANTGENVVIRRFARFQIGEE
jgi:elongation factor Ts